MKVEITKDRILEAASKCSTAKETLKTLFPEVFKDDKYFKLNMPEGFCAYLYGNPHDGNPCIDVSDGIYYSEELIQKSFLLRGNCNWELRHKDGNSFLIPTKK